MKFLYDGKLRIQRIKIALSSLTADLLNTNVLPFPVSAEKRSTGTFVNCCLGAMESEANRLGTKRRLGI